MSLDPHVIRSATLEAKTARAEADDRGLIRALGLWDSTLLVIGLVIGSAVFLVTGGSSGVARLLPSPGLLLVGWIAGGNLRNARAAVSPAPAESPRLATASSGRPGSDAGDSRRRFGQRSR